MKKSIENLVLLAASLQVLESFLPQPVVGVKVGFANFVSLVSIMYFGLPTALNVAVLRTIAASLFLGSFLSISFFLSFFSSLVSTILMGFFYYLTEKIEIFKLSPIGISIIGAVGHNVTQLFSVYLLFLHQKELFYLLPILILSGVISGSITGYFGMSVLRKKENITLVTENIEENCIKKLTLTIKFVTIMKFCILMLFLICIFAIKNISQLLLINFVLVVTFLFYTKNNYKLLLRSVIKVFWFIACSLVIPILFTKSGKVLFNFLFFNVTYDGISYAAVYVLKMLGITFVSVSICNIFVMDEIFFLFKKILFFAPNFAESVVCIILRFPDFFESIKKSYKKLNISKIKSFDKLSEFFIGVMEGTLKVKD